MHQLLEAVRMAFFMFWETFWALVLGFGLSGVVQAFVSHEEMQRAMGDHGPRSVATASGLGMVSSSCSYAATAMAKSLYAKGADFISAMVFMFASTNLVIELGIVLVILMGWQFAAAEFVGGPVMIVLLVAAGALVLRTRVTDRARSRVEHGHDHAAMAGVSEDRQHELEHTPWRVKLRSRAAWADAAAYTMGDITMLRRELAIGYTVAGFIAVYVSHTIWRAVFFSGHGLLTVVENAVIGPFIAIVSFVCSIGNVPLAAALWNGGLSFGGVVSFIFADLITLPLLLIYRKYYGTALMVRLLAVFWLVMSAAGIVVDLVFGAGGLIPGHRAGVVAEAHFAWNYTTFLNFFFVIVLGALYWLYRSRKASGPAGGHAIDPVCGMQVRTADAPATAARHGERFYFCSEHCRDRFEAGAQRPGHLA
jgi:uncharacterized membrane protein YraQ (UPF0718 family)